LIADAANRAAIWSWQRRLMAVALASHTTSTVAPRSDRPANWGTVRRNYGLVILVHAT
jgi:hypothetical protein